MAEPTPIKGHNLSAIQSDIRKSLERIQALKQENADANEAVTEIAKDLKEKFGLPRRAINAALAFLNMDADAQQSFDHAYPFLRELMNAPLQQELFDPARMKQMGNKTKPATEDVETNEAA